MEDLLVIINFYINKKFFNQWYENKEEFKVVVGNLRQNVKNSSIFEKEDGEFFDNVYGALSNIVHPKLNSVRLMSTYQQHAIYLYNGALEVLSFENEERKYVITGNLIVTYIQCEDWGNAKRIIDLVNENELYSLSRDHFFTTKKKSNRNLSRESIGK